MADMGEHIIRIEWALREKFFPCVPPLNQSRVIPNENEVNERLDRSLAACALVEICKADPAAAVSSLLPPGRDMGLDAIHWDAASRRLFFMQARLHHPPEKSRDIVSRAVNAIYYLNARKLDAFTADIRPRLAELIAIARPQNSLWILAVINPYESQEHIHVGIKASVMDHMDHFGIYEYDFDAINRWLGLEPAPRRQEVTRSSDPVPTIPRFPPKHNPGQENSSEEDASPPKLTSSARLEKSRDLELKLILAEQGRPSVEKILDESDFPEIRFELANGHAVRVRMKPFLPYHDYGVSYPQYYSVKVLSSDGTIAMEMLEHYEFRFEREESLAILPRLWNWMEALAATPRQVSEYDQIDDFIADVDEQVDLIKAAGKDTVDQFYKNQTGLDPAEEEKPDDEDLT